MLYPGLALANEPASSPARPTRLVIPDIGLDKAIVPVGLKEVETNGQTYLQWSTDDNLVGWHNLTVPLGQVGNTVLNGHSDIYAKVFQNLNQVEIGAEIMAFSGEQLYRYRVTAKLLVREKGASVEERLANAQLIMPTQDERLTLITCAQPGATHRLIVIAQRLFD
jgi:LPXTG-site transpeptidase (sortase) family protein